MAKIQLTPAELLSQSTEMGNLKTQYESMFQGVNSILQDVNQNWSANLAHNFAGKISTAQKSFDKITEILQAGSDLAGRSATTFESMDSLLASNFSGGSSGGAHGGGGAGFGGSSGGAGSSVNFRGVSASMMANSLSGGAILDAFMKSVGDGWKDAGGILSGFKKWKDKTASGIISNEALKKVAKALGEDSTLSKYMTALSITTDALNGEVGWDTINTYLQEVISKDGLTGEAKIANTALGMKIDAAITTAKVVTDSDGYYMTRKGELESRIEEYLKEGDILGSTGLLAGEFVDTVGKGFLDVGGRVIVSTLHLDTANNLIEAFTGVNIGENVNKFNNAIGDGVSDIIDGTGEALHDVSNVIGDVGAGVIEAVSNAGSGIKDWVGGLFK